MGKASPNFDKIMEITWLDAMADSSDYSSIEVMMEKKPYYCLRKTLGYYIAEDRDYIILAEDVTLKFQGDPPSFSGILGIPKGMIKKKRWIKA